MTFFFIPPTFSWSRRSLDHSAKDRNCSTHFGRRYPTSLCSLRNTGRSTSPAQPHRHMPAGHSRASHWQSLNNSQSQMYFSTSLFQTSKKMHYSCYIDRGQSNRLMPKFAWVQIWAHWSMLNSEATRDLQPFPKGYLMPGFSNPIYSISTNTDVSRQMLHGCSSHTNGGTTLCSLSDTPQWEKSCKRETLLMHLP